MISVDIISDSISEEGIRLTTMQLVYPRWILAELNTHRVFSRNSSSSRAIPIEKLIKMISETPAMPVHWGKNQAGMQAQCEVDDLTKNAAIKVWCEAAKSAASYAKVMSDMGVHKQIVNRLIENFTYTRTVVTSTEWTNFFNLRNHPDAQPEIHELARQMHIKFNEHVPSIVHFNEWHMPYVSNREKEVLDIETQKKVSVARCARVSYLKHDGAETNIDDDVKLYDRLVGSQPLHASPAEHQATPDKISPSGTWCDPEYHGNFTGWLQFRKYLEKTNIGWRQ